MVVLLTWICLICFIINAKCGEIMKPQTHMDKQPVLRCFFSRVTAIFCLLAVVLYSSIVSADTAYVGQSFKSAHYYVTAFGASYQWYKDDKLIQGATDGVIEIFSVTKADEGTYTILATAPGYHPATRSFDLTVIECTYSISSFNQSFGPDGGDGTVNVTTVDYGCPWNISTDVDWIHPTAYGSGNETVEYTVDQNEGPPRSGTMIIAGHVFTVTQSSCQFSVSDRQVPVGRAGGEKSITVTVTGSCYWTVTGLPDWVTVLSGASDYGNGLVRIQIHENLDSYPRADTFNIAGKTVLITQEGQPAADTLIGKHLVMTGSGDGLFSSLQKFRLILGSGFPETFRMSPLEGDITEFSGTYTLDRNGPDNINLELESGIRIELYFDSPTSGSYALMQEESVHNGMFVAGDLAPDWNNDGYTDLVFANDTQAMAAWFMNGTNFIKAAFLREARAPQPGWRVVSENDFNGDGWPDVLLQHDDNRVAVWLMKGTNFLEAKILKGGAKPAGWRAFGTADFNNDDSADVVFQHSDGRLLVWYLHGTNFYKGQIMRDGTAAAPAWKARGTADFNGDGQPDILLQHDNRRLAVSYFIGVTFVSTSLIQQGNPLATGWRVAGMADFNNDAQVDFLFQHFDGRIKATLRQGTNFAGSISLRKANERWKLVGPK